MSLRGDLSEISIGPIIQALSLDHRRGTLRVESGDDEWFFYLGDEGRITLVIPGRRFRLDEALLDRGLIDREELAHARRHARLRAIPVAAALRELDLVTTETLDGILTRNFREVFFELCLREEGSFEFRFGRRPTDFIGPDVEVSRISMDTTSLMMDAMRQIDEFERLRQAIRSTRAIFRPTTSPAEAGHRPGLVLFDGRRTVGEIGRVHEGSPFELYQMIVDLLDEGLIEPIGGPEAVRRAREARAAGDEDLAARMYAWAVTCDPLDLSVLEARLAFLEETGHRGKAIEAAVAVGRRELVRDDLEAALERFEQARELDPRAAPRGPSLEVLTGLHEVHRRLVDEVGREESLPELRRHGLALARTLRSRDRDRDALEVVRSVRQAFEDDPEVRILEGELAESLRDPEEAIGHYEVAAGLLERAGDPPADRAPLYRRILDLDGSRDPVRDRLRRALSEEERRARVGRGLRWSAALAAAATLLVAVFLLLHEMPARGLLATGIELEATGSIGALERARRHHRRILRSYPWSTVADDARRRLAALPGRIDRARERLAAFRRTGSTGDVPAELSVAGGVNEPPAPDDPRREQARNLEEAGSHQAAGRILTELAQEGATDVAIPVLVRTRPPGATVEVDGEVRGASPVLLHVPYGREKTVLARAERYAPRGRVVAGVPTEEVVIALDRAPVFEVEVGGGTTGVAAGGEWVILEGGRGEWIGARGGELVWRRDLEPVAPGEGFAAIGDGSIWVATARGRLLEIDLASGYPNWSAGLVSPTAVPPVLLDREILVVGDRGRVHRYSTEDGRYLGPLGGRTAPDAPLVQVDGTVAGTGFVAEGTSGTVRSLSTTVSTSFPPSLFPRCLVLVTAEGVVSGHDPATGDLAWRIELPHRPRGPAVAAGEHLVVPTWDGRIRAIDPTDGSLRWASEPGLALAHGPVASGEEVWAGTTDGRVVILDRATGEVIHDQWLGRIRGGPFLTDEAVCFLVGTTIQGLAR